MPTPADLFLAVDLAALPDPDINVTWTPWALLAGEVLLQATMVIFILVRRLRPPSVTLAWILLIILVPFLGALIYMLFGEARLGGIRKRRHANIVRAIRERGWPHGELGQYPELSPELQATASLAESVGGLPARGGNSVEIFSDSRAVIDALVDEVDRASHHCHLLFYIFEADQSGTDIGRALQRAASRGVSCRLLVDGVGSRSFLRSKLVAEMRRSGVSVVEALPARLLRAALSRIDLRNHRKLAVFDGQRGFTGSQNVVDASFPPKPGHGPWVDASLRIEGPAVLDLAEIFIEDWFLDADEDLSELLAIRPPEVAGGVIVQILPSGPDDEHDALRLIAQSSFHMARQELIVTTPYFVPGEAEVVALCTAARRGVSTTLVVPRRNDSRLVATASRGLYHALLESGVQIHEYTAGLLHAKTMTVDRSLALVGTANFDRRSFELNFEISVLIYDSDSASSLRFLQRSYMNDAVPVNAGSWPKRPWHRRLLENAAGMLSPLL